MIRSTKNNIEQFSSRSKNYNVAIGIHCRTSMYCISRHPRCILWRSYMNNHVDRMISWTMNNSDKWYVKLPLHANPTLINLVNHLNFQSEIFWVKWGSRFFGNPRAKFNQLNSLCISKDKILHDNITIMKSSVWDLSRPRSSDERNSDRQGFGT